MARSHGTGKATMVAVALVGSMSMMATLSPAAAAGTAPKAEVPKPTASEYVAWLDGQSDADADRTAEQFKALSSDDQAKFLNYIADPELVTALAGEKGDPSTDPDTETRRTASSERVTTRLAGGDVVITSEGGVTAPATRGTAGDWSCYNWVNYKVFGIEIAKHTLKQWYRSTTTKVDKVYSASATHKNLNPGVQVSNQPEDQWISAAGNALAYAVWNIDFVYSGSAIHSDKRQHIRCDETGYRFGYFKDA
ncbi:hypothetical protein ACIQMO_08620 [Streptomyces sp. NPDC091406]|uniref:hypothetical protein n=1 Tax=unclassified Streptomyces TaxID=2593676 RepID=UPI0037F1151E